MEQKTYSIFGAGAAGLYTAWRLLSGKVTDPKFKAKQLVAGDKLELYDWGKYDFMAGYRGTRAAGARICTWHFKNDKRNSYVELGGMRYSYWDWKAPNANDGLASGHRLVTTVIAKLGLDKFSVPFNVTTNQLFYLRTRNFYLDDISSNQPAPYAVDHYGASATPDQGFTTVENLSVTATTGPQTRAEWCAFYNHGRITAQLPDTSVFQRGDLLKDIGYWNLLYDQLGSEGYDYAADGNGYSSNVINTNSAWSFNENNDFAPGTQYKTLTIGYSGMFNSLFEEIVNLCQKQGIVFKYYANTRLRSIVKKDKRIHYTFATRENPSARAGSRTCDAAWMAMPRAAIEQVAQANLYGEPEGLDVLNDRKVTLYIESAVKQPSYKVGMFFSEPWWTKEAANPPTYPALIEGWVVTPQAILKLKSAGVPAKTLQVMQGLIDTPFASPADLLTAIEQGTGQRGTLAHDHAITAACECNTIGPSVTDTPIRMMVYFGNNALDQKQKPVYGLLASYDDEDNYTFWQELELGPKREREIPISQDTQPLEGPRTVPPRMVKMLRKMMAEIHFGPNSNYSYVPEPLEAAYMDWSLPPFGAGYHQWAAHYDIGDVQRKIRKPSQLIRGADAEIYIVGEAYSNDQAWVEGAYCTAESVLNDFFGVQPIIDNKNYPFICPR